MRNRIREYESDWLPRSHGADGAFTYMGKRSATTEAASVEAASDVSLPLFTVQLRQAMTAKRIPLDAAEVVKGLASVGVEISSDAATRHITGENFKGRPDNRLRLGYEAWLGVKFAKAAKVEAAVDSLIGDAESAARRTPKAAHADLDVLLRSENGGLVKYVLRRLRQLTPTRP